MVEFSKNCRHHWRAVICAGVAAGILATLVQVLLWLLFTDEFPAIMFRDARLTAALLLGSRVLPPPATFDMSSMVAATFIHFALSILYAAMLAPIAARLGSVAAWVAGAGFGVALYAVNLYGLTEIFPWFVAARGWIAAVAHVAFGATAVLAYRFLQFMNARSRLGGH